MKLLEMADAIRYPRMTTAELRETFLLSDLFHPGAINVVYVDVDRTVIGGCVPTIAPLTLETHPNCAPSSSASAANSASSTSAPPAP